MQVEILDNNFGSSKVGQKWKADHTHAGHKTTNLTLPTPHISIYFLSCNLGRAPNILAKFHLKVVCNNHIIIITIFFNHYIINYMLRWQFVLVIYIVSRYGYSNTWLNHLIIVSNTHLIIVSNTLNANTIH